MSQRALKRSVVVLDFRASWCDPCRESLPHLDWLHREMSQRDVRIYAMNLRAENAAVTRFLDQSNLTLPVLLDADGKVAQRYGVSSIPQTVVIGKNGVIQNVLFGFAPDGDARLRDAMERALRLNY